MDSSAELGPSVHTICEAREDSSVSRVPKAFHARAKATGAEGNE